MSEFGKGFVYCLGLFAKHHERINPDSLATFQTGKCKGAKYISSPYWSYFNGASDHLYELEVPDIFKGTEIEKLALEIQDKSLEMGHGTNSWQMTHEDGEKAFNEMSEKLDRLLMLVDEHLGLKPEESECS